MNPISAKCGHVKRRLAAKQPLTGKVLEFALAVIDEGARGQANELLNDMAAKLKAQEPLDDYELHLMLDVFLLHKRLRARG